jgi:hypothetical protein
MTSSYVAVACQSVRSGVVSRSPGGWVAATSALRMAASGIFMLPAVAVPRWLTASATIAP